MEKPTLPADSIQRFWNGGKKFGETDESQHANPRRKDKRLASEAIARDVEAFLKSGGKVERYGAEASGIIEGSLKYGKDKGPGSSK